MKKGKHGYLSLGLPSVFASHIEASKEQQTRLEALEKENDQLKNDIKEINIQLGIQP